MDRLLRERKALAPRIERVSHALRKLETSDSTEIIDVVTEIDSLNGIWASYLSVHKQILDAAKTEIAYDEAIAHLLAFEEEYLALKRSLLKLQKHLETQIDHDATVIQQDGGTAMQTFMQQQAEFLRLMSANMAAAGASSSASTSAQSGSLPLPDLRLPRMNLPVFSGNYLEWQSFYDLFQSSVHLNATLRPSQKLYFLKIHLAGEAASLVSHLNVEDINYAPALSKLKARYNKPFQIANMHISRFLSQPSMTSSSPLGLRSLHDVSDEVIRALKALEREDRDIWLLHILYEKLDQHSKELWCQKIVDMEQNDITLDKFLKFIDSQSDALQSAQSTRRPISTGTIPKSLHRGASAFVATNQQSPVCGTCSRPGHQPYQCGKFIHTSPHERLSLVFSLKLCQNCLKYHEGEPCRSGTCRKCGLAHHTLLHNALESNDQTNTVSPDDTTSSAPHSLISALSLADHLDGGNVLLLTATIHVFDKHGRPHAVRAVLDSASHISFITRDLCDKLGLEKAEISLEFQGISATSSRSNSGAAITIASRCSKYRTEIPCAILERISGDLPLRPVNIDAWPIPDSVHLADPQFHHPGKISVLLGLQPFLDIWEPGRIDLDPAGRLPILQNTKLGWVVSGRYEECPPVKLAESTCLITCPDDSLSRQIERFFEVEEYANTEPHFSEEEKRCEAHFDQHVKRDSLGCFHVRLPFRENPETLGESRDVAAKRLFHIESKLAKNPQLKEQYHAFLRDYIDAGHMSLVKTPAPMVSVYLPHHCVVKEASSTTKCRVVFDASAKTSSGKSLNDVLMTGPVLQDSLINILLRFRFPAIAITGDIRQMYRMVQLAEEDRNYQRILWRWSNSEPIEEYTLNTVTYGTKTASYLATKCIQQLFSEFREIFPDATGKARKGIYIDDVITGAETEEGARQLREQLSDIFSAGGFHLRKWATNNPAVLDGVPKEDIEMQLPIDLNDESTIKTLGILWQPSIDQFQFRYKPSSVSTLSPTKRTILSQIASLFDPLGLISPVIVKAKLVMQRLWQLKVDWDSTPPMEVLNEWQSIVNGFSAIDEIRIPRRVLCDLSVAKILIHGYCDASERALGACVYIRTIDGSGRATSHLLCSKSKVAPIGNGQTTIPRLELCAAVLLARLITNVKSAIECHINEVRAYTDSQVVLAWLAGGASRWKPFVGNRVAEVSTKLPAINWSHVRTDENPADIISRGALPETLHGNSLWWHGPEWQHSVQTQELCSSERQQVDREKRAVSTALLAMYENQFLDNMMARYYPNQQMLLRITARLFRFLSRGPEQLTAAELDRALMMYLKHTQRKYFSADIDRLERGADMEKSSSLRQLKPFLDQNGLLRVGGRLQQSDLSYDTKHQLLLPRNSILTSMILHYHHTHNLHCGPQTLLAITRRRFWILCGTSAARKMYRQCIVCTRAKPTPIQQQMGQLPSDRVRPLPAFAVTGVDYAGPINIISRKTRGAVATKGYIALFVCFATKAVAIEAVSDLSTAAFLAAFTRFSSVYGYPAKMYSDNATNFRAADKNLKEVSKVVNSKEHNRVVADFLADKRVEWSFIPPRSPHHGGLWEAGVKVAKQLLGKLSGNFTYTFEELSTLLKQVAACMNSRPISPISNDPSDPEPLTPAHFTIGRPLTTVPEINQLERNISSLTRWQFVQRAAQEFRARWQMEYVRSLQRLTKWQKSTRNVVVGNLVLLVGDNDKPKQWPLGRVLELHPGPDKLVRVVTLKTRNGVTQRDVRRIRVVPLDEDEYMPGRLGTEIPDRNLVGGLCRRAPTGKPLA